MRIIAGKFKGRKLADFSGKQVRPTSDRAREGIFSVLQFEIEGKTFLDAFCGSGAMGIEALSRGAKESVFLDISKKSCELTKQNLKLVGEQAEVVNINCLNYLLATQKKFDIIFLDAPYKSSDGKEALKVIAKRDILTPNGVVIIESESVVNQPIDGLFVQKTKKYGIAEFAFYKKVDHNVCVFAGSFDPFTNGHLYVVEQAKKRFKKVIVAVGDNQNKNCTFDKNTRLEMLKGVFEKDDCVKADAFSGYLVDYLKSNKTVYNIRGVRGDEDLAYEEKMLDFNAKLFPEIKNVYIKADKQVGGISSTAVRNLLKQNQDISFYVPKQVKEIIDKYPL